MQGLLILNSKLIVSERKLGVPTDKINPNNSDCTYFVVGSICYVTVEANVVTDIIGGSVLIFTGLPKPKGVTWFFCGAHSSGNAVNMALSINGGIAVYYSSAKVGRIDASFSYPITI